MTRKTPNFDTVYKSRQKGYQSSVHTKGVFLVAKLRSPLIFITSQAFLIYCIKKGGLFYENKCLEIILFFGLRYHGICLQYHVRSQEWTMDHQHSVETDARVEGCRPPGTIEIVQSFPREFPRKFSLGQF